MDNTIYGLFQKIVREHKAAPAIIENNRTMTFGELSDMTDMIADSFPDNARAVGIVMRHRAEMIASILAALKTGALYVPAEPDFPSGRIRYMMEESGVDFVLTEMQCAQKLENFKRIYSDCSICVAAPGSESRVYAQSPDSLAYILYTSGTTGRPKGVSVTNRNVCHYVRAFANEFHPVEGDILLQYSVCSFDIFVEETFGALLSGAALAIPSAKDKENIGRLMRFAEAAQVTIISGFPYLLQEMNDLPEIPASLRLLISGGDVLRASYVDRLVGKAAVYNTYGPSETTVCASYYNCSEGAPLPDGTYPVGKPIQGAEIVILDEDGNEAPQGRTGEICILGGGVSLGYFGDRKKENAAFESLADGRRMYHSGDLGYCLPDGNIAFLHRKDTQIMILGKRVEVSEVENVLLQSGLVRQACVRPQTDDRQLSYMVAYIVKRDEGIALPDIKAYLAEYLAEFMIPEFFVEMERLPLNANGKVDTAALPAPERKRAAA